MCLCLFAIKQHEEFPFILLANRDEFRKRPSAKATFWKDEPHVLAGRDLQQMGTWLGINSSGNMAFLTNHRDMKTIKNDAPSRGHLVSDFLIENPKSGNYLHSIKAPHAYNGFNLVVGKFEDLHYFSNVENKVCSIGAGIHGLSNALLNTSWPKVDFGKKELQKTISANNLKSETLFSILENTERPTDSQLPETGVGIELERMLSSRFINTQEYGTVCSTLIKIDRNNRCFFEERTFNSNGNKTGQVVLQFDFKG